MIIYGKRTIDYIVVGLGLVDVDVEGSTTSTGVCLVGLGVVDYGEHWASIAEMVRIAALKKCSPESDEWNVGLMNGSVVGLLRLSLQATCGSEVTKALTIRALTARNSREMVVFASVTQGKCPRVWFLGGLSGGCDLRDWNGGSNDGKISVVDLTFLFVVGGWLGDDLIWCFGCGFLV